jgi:hypothetical protein
MMVEKAYALTSIVGILKNYSDPTKQDWGTFYDFTISITGLALDFVGILAIIMIMYSAILYISALGDEAKLTSAKGTLIWSIVGLIVIVLSKVIIAIVRKELA